MDADSWFKTYQTPPPDNPRDLLFLYQLSSDLPKTAEIVKKANTLGVKKLIGAMSSIDMKKYYLCTSYPHLGLVLIDTKFEIDAKDLYFYQDYITGLIQKPGVLDTIDQNWTIGFPGDRVFIEHMYAKYCRLFKNAFDPIELYHKAKMFVTLFAQKNDCRVFIPDPATGFKTRCLLWNEDSRMMTQFRHPLIQDAPTAQIKVAATQFILSTMNPFHNLEHMEELSPQDPELKRLIEVAENLI